MLKAKFLKYCTKYWRACMSSNTEDVAMDGNCFYRCLARCVSKDMGLTASIEAEGMEEDEIVVKLRKLFAKSLCRHAFIQQWVSYVVEAVRACPECVADYPVLEVLSIDSLLTLEEPGFDCFIRRCARAIRQEGMWASELEVTIARRWLHVHDIGLLIVEQSDDVAGVADQIRKIVQHDVHKRCLVFIRIEHVHYEYLTHQDSPIIEKAELLQLVEN